ADQRAGSASLARFARDAGTEIRLMGTDVINKHGIRFTRRGNEMRISPTLAVMNRAMELTAQGIDIVDLGPGEPDFPTPASVCEAGKRAIDKGLTKYTSG